MKLVNQSSFQVNVEGEPVLATLRFATRNELQRYHRSLSLFARASSTTVREAVEFTRLAAKRWRYYSRGGEAAESFTQLRGKIRHHPKREVAFIMVATTLWQKRELPVGLAYCRRTWCHHLALDFLAVHPRALSRGFRVKGVGSGIMFGLVELANTLEIPRIWGEATANSAQFYENLLAVQTIQDLFIIEATEMAAIAKRQERTSNPNLVSEPGTKLQ